MLEHPCGRAAEIGVSPAHDAGCTELLTLVVDALVYFSSVC